LKEVINYTDNDGRRMVVAGNGMFAIAAPAEMLEQIETMLQSVEASVGRRFDPKQPTVGTLVGLPLGASQETAETAAAVDENENNSSPRFDPMQPTVGSLVGLKTVPHHYGGIRGEPADIAVHPRIKEVSR
jgi:hypothetical protein